MVFVLDRPDARLRDSALREMRQFASDDFGETFAVTAQPEYRPSFFGADFETSDAIEDVVGPVCLAILAVIDDVDAGRGLFLDHIAYG